VCVCVCVCACASEREGGRERERERERDRQTDRHDEGINGAAEVQLYTPVENSLWHLLNRIPMVGPTTILDAWEKIKIHPSKESNYDSLVIQLTA